MGKKSIPDHSKNKKNKTKYKEMFPQLATHQEEVVHKKQESRIYQPKRVIYEHSQSDVQLEVLEHHNTNLDHVCETVHRLLSKNKVSAKNAFDIPLIDLQDLPDFAASLQNEYAWKKLSSTLENDYKIYGYRVDAIHSITYNILHTMSRRQQEVDMIQNAPENSVLDKQASIKIPEGSQSEHIERKLENLDLTALELALGVDPILQRNKRKFDQLGNNSMLLDTLPIDDFLTLTLAKSSQSHKIYPPWGQYNGPWKFDDPIMAFCQLSNFRTKFQEDIQGKMKDEQIYQMLLQQKENHFSGNYLNIKLEAQNLKKNMFKDHKLKNIYMRDEHDLIEDAKIWMEEEKRMVNMRKVPNRMDSSMRYQIKLQDPAERIDFDGTVLTRQEIFRKQNDKMEFHEQIEDRFLIANKLQYSFDIINYPLTLKENPPLPKTQKQAQTQVDVRRQMVSILEAKKRMKDLIHERSTFKAIYENYSISEDISPALCFLTILHLANENNLTLQQLDESNFYVH